MFRLILIALLVCPTTLVAQESKIRSTINFYDGSVLHCSPEFNELQIATKYGNLDIPLSDMLRVNIGYHCEPVLEGKINGALKDLSSATFSLRAAADKFLRTEFEHSYGPLKNFKSKDMETNKRAADILEFIRTTRNPQVFDKQPDDEIHLCDGSILKGKISGPTKYEFKTKNLEKVTATLYGMKDITIYGNRQMTYEIKEVTTVWKNSGILVSGKFRVKASGEIDLYPGDVGKYTSTPKGMENVQGRNGFKSGALLIRYNGVVAKCGEEFSGHATSPTVIEFMIESTPWAVQPNDLPPTGCYRIEVFQND